MRALKILYMPKSGQFGGDDMKSISGGR